MSDKKKINVTILPADTELDIHELAKLVPPMQAEEFEALKTNISKQGIVEPIVLYEDKILDGANRYKAAKELGREIPTRLWKKNECGSPAEFVLTKIIRRNLTSSQRAMFAVMYMPYLEAEAAERQRAGKSPDDNGNDLPRKIGEGKGKHDGEAAVQAAKLFHTNADYVRRAAKILKSDPARANKIRSGEQTLPPAKGKGNRKRRGTNTAKKASVSKEWTAQRLQDELTNIAEFLSLLESPDTPDLQLKGDLTITPEEAKALIANLGEDEKSGVKGTLDRVKRTCRDIQQKL